MTIMKKILRSDYLSISEFAKNSEINWKTLIFYDKIGLFSPKYVAPNGTAIIRIDFCHWYAERPGYAIGRNKKYLGDCSPQDAVTFLEQRREDISEKIQQLQRVQDMLNTKLNVPIGGMQQHSTEIVQHQRQPKEIFWLFIHPVL